jgi:hypothetical protein
LSQGVLFAKENWLLALVRLNQNISPGEVLILVKKREGMRRSGVITAKAGLLCFFGLVCGWPVFGQEQKELQTVIEDICSKAKLIKDISFDKERVLI